MTKEGIYEFISRQKVTDPDYCILKFTGFEAQWFSGRRTETVRL